MNIYVHYRKKRLKEYIIYSSEISEKIPSCLHELSFLRDGISFVFSLMAPLNNSGAYLPISPKVTNNKRPMGHIAHMRNQFKSIISYDYIITLIWKGENQSSTFYNKIIHFYKTLSSFHPRMPYAIVWLKSTQWFCRRRFLDFVFSLFGNYLPFKRGLTQECFLPSLVQFGKCTWFLRRFLNFVNVFSLFRN